MDRGAGYAAVHGIARSRTRLSHFTFTFHFHALEKAMATHSSVLAWRIPGTEEPGGLPSIGSHRFGHDWSDLAAAAAALDLQDFLISCKFGPLSNSFPDGASCKEPACQYKRCKRHGFNPWVGRNPRVGHGNPLQCSCLENPKDRRVWQATGLRVTQNQTQLKRLSRAYP